jgi:4-amino-4-deoxy-L-arabinose transferase-like glycosyltransferase
MFNNGPAGLSRLFDGELGGQASWLLPLALVALVAAASRRVRFPLDRRQQAVLLWGTWLLTVGAFFSVAGFFHSYYLITLAPAVAALAAIAIVTLARDYLTPDRAWRAWALPAALVVTAAGQAFILSNFPSWSRWITPPLAGITVAAAGVLVVMRLRRKLQTILWKGALAAGLLALLIAPTAWTIDTVSASNGGQIPSAGPSPTFAGNTFRGAFPDSGPGFANGGAPRAGGSFAPGGATTGTPPQVPGQGAFGGFGNGSAGGFGNGPAGGSFGSTVPVTGTAGARGGFRAGVGFRGGFGGPGGGGGDASVDKQLLQYLEQHQGSTRYLFAVGNSMSAAPYIIQTGKPVMSLGGFSGSDPILTTAQLKALIQNNTVRYFLLGGGGGGPDNSSLTSWVQQSCTAVSPSAWQTSATSGSSTSNATSGGFMRQQLYDCGNLVGAAN